MKKLSTLRRYIFFYLIWPLAFKLFSIKKINKNQIIFAVSKNYSKLPDNMVPLYNKLKNQYNCIILTAPDNPLKRAIFGIKFQKYYAQSGTVFITDNFDQLYAHKPNKGTRVIQLWHACGAFKKWGYSTLDNDWGGDRKEMLRFPMHNTYTDVFISSDVVKNAYADAFRCSPEIIKALGVPRTDIYFNTDFVKNAKKYMPDKSGRKIILYAPTFRGFSPEQSYNDFKLDLKKLKNLFCEEYIFYIKAHPFTAKQINLQYPEGIIEKDFAYNVSDINIETALCAADILITDYSSLIFEYSLLDRPMIFYAYDLNEYKKSRSFYSEYEEFVPGRIACNEDELIDSISEVNFDKDRIKAFRQKYMTACDGKSTERITEYLFGSE